MESRAAHYRRLAEECLALSRLDGFSMQGRLNLLEMARIWNRLAQQQQQVQPEKDGECVPEHNEAPAMAADPNRLSLEPERSSWSAVPYRDIQMRIGQALRLEYELPQELPDRLLTLLMKLTGREEGN
jgi:hypothetical protein